MSLRARTISIGLLSLFMVLLCLPSLLSRQVREGSPWIPDQAVNLGLDLQGGIYWLMRIDVDEAAQQRTRQAANTLEEIQAEEGVLLGEIRLVDSDKAIEVCGASPEALQDLIDDRFQLFEVTSGPERCERMQLSSYGIEQVVSVGVDQSIEVLQTRLSEGGFQEPIIAKQGEDRILVQMPGYDFDDRNLAKRLISVTTKLEFKKVLDMAPNEGLLLAGYGQGLPEGTEVVLERQDEDVIRAYLVESTPIVTGANLEDARLDYDPRTQQPQVGFVWDAEGTTRFREFTGENIGTLMAIIRDDEVISAPEIQARIGQRGVIEGKFTVEEARTLAVQLRSGALPIRLLIEEERTIGPSLGEDSIRAGIWSIAVGGLLVVAFMVAYYKTSGLLANVALLLNLIIVLAVMSSFQATLTLPGIAGLVLTIGMAVDANVLIFERIREELRAGRPVRGAVQIGFNRSRLTILDANITTLIAAIVLYVVGHGPVQGFGVTLIIGIGSSVFCALVVTRLLFDLLLARGGQTLRI